MSIRLIRNYFSLVLVIPVILVVPFLYMFKLLSLICLVLFILLTPPAVLAYISQDAVPGDITYPIKRKLEDGIVLVAAINPTTKAIFSVDRSTRRFKESSALLSKGKVPIESLSELIFQTQLASTEIAQVKDPVEKKRLQEKLEKSIGEYIQGLTEAKKQVKDENPNPQFNLPQTSPTPEPSNFASQKPQPTPTLKPSTSPLPTTKPS